MATATHATSETAAELQTAATAAPFPRNTLVWILLSVLATGGLVGWLTGLSDSPIAGVLLPLLLTLVAGAGGFHFAAKRADAPLDARLVRPIAQATTAFMLSCGFAMHLGILVRTSQNEPHRSPGPLAQLTPANSGHLTSGELLRLMALEQRSRLLDTGLNGDILIRQLLAESKQRSAFGPSGPPARSDLDQLTEALKAVSEQLDRAREPSARPSTDLARFRGNIPSYLGHIQKLREFVERTHRRIPTEHYDSLLEAISDSNRALITHHEGNQKGAVLTPAPVMDYLPLYGLDLVVAIQKEQFEERRSRSDGEDAAAITLIDDAIRLKQGHVATKDAPTGRYSVKH